MKLKALNDATDPKKQVSEKKYGDFSSNWAQINKNVTLNVEDQTEDSSVNNEKQDEDKSVNLTNKVADASVCDSFYAEEITEYANVNTEKQDEDTSVNPSDNPK